jgi:antirestriction protein
MLTNQERALFDKLAAAARTETARDAALARIEAARASKRLASVHDFDLAYEGETIEQRMTRKKRAEFEGLLVASQR